MGRLAEVAERTGQRTYLPHPWCRRCVSSVCSLRLCRVQGQQPEGRRDQAEVLDELESHICDKVDLLASVFSSAML